jgi:hypothetical protein
MKFGESLKKIFEAHYEDLASDKKESIAENTRYNHKKLIAQLDLIPWKWKQFLYQEFLILSNSIRENILKNCSHEKYNTPFEGHRECQCCGAKQNLVLEDNSPQSYNENKIWTSWDL